MTSLIGSSLIQTINNISNLDESDNISGSSGMMRMSNIAMNMFNQSAKSSSFRQRAGSGD